MSALSEIIIEWASGGIGSLNTKQGLAGVSRKATDTRVGKAVANNAFVKNVNKWLMSESGKWLTSRISGMTGEGVEEIVPEYVGPLLQRATYDPEANMPTMDDVKQAFMGGFGAAGIMGVSHDALNGRMLKDPARFELGKVEKFDVWDDIDAFDSSNVENQPTTSQQDFNGAQHMIAGGRAKRAPLRAQNIAERMQKEGYSSEEIRQYTNWIQDVEDNWKWEFSDEDARINQRAMERVQKGKTVRLGDLITHDELYRNYSELRDMPVEKSQNKYESSYKPSSQTIELSQPADVETALHEVQHAVQHIQGFAKGFAKGG